MRNPNATAAATTATAAIAAEQLAETYLNLRLGPLWGKVAVAATASTVLYIGRRGLKGTLAELARTAKAIWSGPTNPPSESPT